MEKKENLSKEPSVPLFGKAKLKSYDIDDLLELVPSEEDAEAEKNIRI